MHLFLARATPGERGSAPSYFVVVPGATDVKQALVQGKDQIIYHPKSQYPADDVLNAIKRRLKQLGWQPLHADWLTPACLLLFEVGNSTRIPRRTLRQACGHRRLTGRTAITKF